MSLKAVNELGLRKSVRYVLGSIFMLALKLSIVPPLRVFLLRAAGAQIGENSVVEDVTFINFHHRGFSSLKIGKNCIIAKDCLLDLTDEIMLHDSAVLAPRVSVLTHTNIGYSDHPLKMFYPESKGRVVFSEGSYAGCGSIILPGVTLGKMSVIAAGSVANRSVPEKSVAGGVPAKIIKKIGGG